MTAFWCNSCNKILMSFYNSTIYISIIGDVTCEGQPSDINSYYCAVHNCKLTTCTETNVDNNNKTHHQHKIIGNINVTKYQPGTTCQCIYEFVGQSHHSVCGMHLKGLTYGTKMYDITIPKYEPGTTCQCIYEHLGDSHKK